MTSPEAPQARLIVNISGYKGSGVTTAIRTLRAVRPDIGALMGILSPTEQLRAYATDRGFPLRTQGDYGRTHEQFEHSDPNGILREVAGLAARHELVIIDGLLSYTDAQRIQERFPDVYRTLTVDCPLGIRYLRAATEAGLDPRDLPRQYEDLGSFAADERAELARLYPWRVMDMHDLGPAPVNGAQTRTKVAEAVARPIADHLGLAPVLDLP